MGCSLVFVCISMQKASGGSAQKDVCEHTLVWQKPPERMQDPGKKCLPFYTLRARGSPRVFRLCFYFAHTKLILTVAILDLVPLYTFFWRREVWRGKADTVD